MTLDPVAVGFGSYQNTFFFSPFFFPFSLLSAKRAFYSAFLSAARVIEYDTFVPH